MNYYSCFFFTSIYKFFVLAMYLVEYNFSDNREIAVNRLVEVTKVCTSTASFLNIHNIVVFYPNVFAFFSEVIHY